MASTYTTNTNLELQGTGDNSGTWGTELNTAVFTIIDNVFGGVQTVSLSGGSVTLNTTQSQNNYIKLTGALPSDVTVTFPAIGRTYIVANNTTGAHTVTLRIGVSTGVAITQNTTGVYALDASDVSGMTVIPTYVYTTASGTNTITATYSPAITAYGTGTPIYALKIANANTGSTTLNFNSLGAKTVKTLAGANLIAGQLAAGMIALFAYDGTNMQLLNPNPVSYRYMGVQTFTGSGTYTPTSGVAYIEVEVIGGGGGGGAASSSNTDSTAGAGGGGAGAYSVYRGTTVTSQTVTIGGGGNGASSSGANGSNGTSSSFGALAVSGGGTGGGSIAGTNSFELGGRGAGGTASAGTLQIAGENGIQGSVADGVSSAVNYGYGGNGGSTNYGAGGKGGENGVGAAGTGYGSGGGGGGAKNSNGSSVAGANGAGGLILVKEFSLA